jgi:hypothetical protein
MMEEMITVPKSEYDRLKEIVAFQVLKVTNIETLWT